MYANYETLIHALAMNVIDFSHADIVELKYRVRRSLPERLGLGLARLGSAFGSKAFEPAAP